MEKKTLSMKILSFTQPQVVANLYEFLSFAEHKDILENNWNQTVVWHH